MDENSIFIDEKGLIRSRVFDDLYFSAEDGLAESDYNFIKGNDLPKAWQDKDSFTICELGFGTGLNMMLTLDYWLKEGGKGSKLRLISIEKHPLDKEMMARALTSFKDKLGAAYDCMMAAYPKVVLPGFQIIKLSADVELLLIYSDVEEALKSLDVGIDCWFLDGFNPAKNQAMWSDKVFEEVARLSNQHATFATFTAAGFVKRGLLAVGFEVSKEKGFGRKRERLTGRFTKEKRASKVKTNIENIAIIGGGIAGATLAYHLACEGVKVDLYEAKAQVGEGASGNALGLINPKITALPSMKTDFYTQAYSYALSFYKGLQGLEDVAFDQRGSLHIAIDDKRLEKFEKMVGAAGWPQSALRLVEPQEASELSGLPISRDALWMPLSAALNPQKTVQFLCAHALITVNRSMQVQSLNHVEDKGWQLNNQGPFYQNVVLANGMEAGNLLKPFTTDVPLQPVRGQVTNVSAPDMKNLRVNLCFGGYVSRLEDGSFMLGATYDRDVNDDEHRVEDDQSNIDYFKRFFDQFGEEMAASGGRAGVRVSASDYMPIIGPVEGHKGLYCHLAHRSHGLTTAPLSSHFLADLILGRDAFLPKAIQSSLSPGRFAV